MSDQSITVVIISYNTKDLVRTCIQSAWENLDLKRDQLIVVDNASVDGSVDMVRNEFPNVEVQANEINKGFSYACNCGLKKAKGEFVLFLNGDVQLPKGTLDQMRKIMAKNKKVGILSPQLIGENDELTQMTWGWNISLTGEVKQKFFSPRNIEKRPFVGNLVRRLQNRERDVPIVAGACMLTRKDVMTELGGLDEDFDLYFEDADLCKRCWEIGYSVRFVPNVKVFHGLGQSGKKNKKRIFLVYRQSQILFYRKHNSSFQLKALKVYLWLKFFLSPVFWLDGEFRYWIRQILTENKHLHLYRQVRSGNPRLSKEARI